MYKDWLDIFLQCFYSGIFFLWKQDFWQFLFLPWFCSNQAIKIGMGLLVKLIYNLINICILFEHRFHALQFLYNNYYALVIIMLIILLFIFCRHHNNITLWLVKWLTFRLMFCSGVVKLSSRCPTWWGLTALDWHYESQVGKVSVRWSMWHSHDWPT